ncbi:MAG: hypothetical protein NT145_03100 [Elusimicrobia bacterium]|nr:hypothetical protein [Elusimicrobiota bacterium]
MAVQEIKKINLVSVLKSIPIVFGVLGIVIGIFTFFLFPTEIARNLSIGARLLSWLIFVILYTAIMVLGIVLISWLYNVVVAKIGGISVELEQKES